MSAVSYEMIGAEGGSRTRTSLRTTDFKSDESAITKSYEKIRTSIYAPSGRQGIASSGYVSTRPATILAPSSALNGSRARVRCRRRERETTYCNSTELSGMDSTLPHLKY
jgi:hypothetical protein